MKQKVLFERILEFLESKYCTGNKNAHREWLLEFTCHTKASNPREITPDEIDSFANYVLSQRTPYTRDEAAKVLRKFFAWCVLKRYMFSLPTERVQPNENDKEHFIKKVLSIKPTSAKASLVKKIRELRNGEELSFGEIAKRLTTETGKTHHRGNICYLYHNAKI
jgi:hypothetical protein